MRSVPARTFVAEDDEPYEVEAAYRQHRGWLLGFLRRRFGGQDAEDLAQETYLRAVAAGAIIRNPKAFLARVALNAARDQARRRKVRPRLVGAEAGPPAIALPVQDQALLLKDAILALPPKLQDVFLLSRFGGLTYEEIAHRLQISVKTVEKRMTKALAMCAVLME